MQFRIKRLASVTAGTSDTVIYTVPTGRSAILKEVLLCNTDNYSTMSTVTVNLIPSGSIKNVSNTLLSHNAINGTETQGLKFSTSLEEGDRLIISCSTDAVVGVTISGIEITY